MSDPLRIHVPIVRDHCEHAHATLNARTWIERCPDCGAWRMADEVLPLGRWRPKEP